MVFAQNALLGMHGSAADFIRLSVSIDQRAASSERVFPCPASAWAVFAAAEAAGAAEGERVSGPVRSAGRQADPIIHAAKAAQAL